MKQFCYPSGFKRYFHWSVSVFLCLVLMVGFLGIDSALSLAEEETTPPSGYLGSSQCRPCHEKFYQLWEPSHHGRAMQPYTEAFAEKNLKPQMEDIVIGKVRYRGVIDEGPGFVIESDSINQKKYPILHALGGKNVYYFLTLLERGHLQVLPIAFDVNKQRWFDTAASAVRHFPELPDRPIHWTDRQYTFNTSCYGCHVSQLVKNYDPKTDAYNTQWKEAGINCETCHGPADEHVKVCLEAGEGNAPKQMKLKTITQSRGYTAHQVNAACSVCHAKASYLDDAFVPGDDYFQHADLLTLEHVDYYPDGRDLGENYTYTSWRMSPCVKAGKLDCMYCHTSSGRFRFKDHPNDTCISCHPEKGEQFKAHTHHDTDDVTCIQCHMPMTGFGRMDRSDHSMRPPMPSATLQFQSPNACNLCHKDKDAEWADGHVRKWHQEDYQKPVLEIASLVDQARKGNWAKLSDMMAYLKRPDKDEVFANSLVRLLRGHHDERIGALLVKLLENDPSPMIRASAADGLQSYLDAETIASLAKAAKDPYRVVRTRMAPTLAPVPEQMIPADMRQAVQRATEEYIVSMKARPDDAMSHYNLGNFYATKNQPSKAVDFYEKAIKLRDDMILPYVNASLVYNQLGKNDTAADRLKQAIVIEPNNVAAHLNLALLYGEMGKREQAQAEFRKTLQLDPTSAVAAYNLCVLLAENNPDESIRLGRKALKLQPDNARYAYTLAFYLDRAGQTEELISTLEPFVSKKTSEANVYLLLGQTYEKMGNRSAAVRVYQAAAENNQLPEQARSYFITQLQRLTTQ